jgi:hypothetical protein
MMSKKFLSVGLAILGGVVLGVLLTYLVLIPSSIYLFFSPADSPNGYPLPGGLFYYNTSTATLEVWVNGTVEDTLGPNLLPNLGNPLIEWGGTEMVPGDYKISLKIPTDVYFINLGSVTVPPDRQIWLVIQPDLSVQTKTTRWQVSPPGPERTDFYVRPSPPSP